MRFSFLMCVCLMFAACSSPGISSSGAEPIRVNVDGSTFDVYVLEDEVQAIRVNFEMLPSFTEIAPRAIIAMEQATGCTVVMRSFSGDQAVVKARISC